MLSHVPPTKEPFQAISWAPGRLSFWSTFPFLHLGFLLYLSGFMGDNSTLWCWWSRRARPDAAACSRVPLLPAV